MHALDILKYGNLTFVKSVEAVPETHWDTQGVCGVWSVKDIIAHLASYEIVLAEILSGLVDGSEMPTLDKWINAPMAFNDDQVLLRRAKSAGDVLAEYTEAHMRVVALAAQLPEEKWRQPGTLPWYGTEYSLDDLIVYQYYGHKREHSAEIAVFLDRISQ